jgi:spermidine synthase
MVKFLYRNRPRSTLTVVEIDEAVVKAAAQFFKLPIDPRRIKIEVGDGHDFVAATEREFDLIMVDGFDAKSGVGKLDTLAFYQNCGARLSRYGVLVANFLNARRGLALQPDGQWSPLGHFVLGDVYALQGRRLDAESEVAKGRRLAASVRK